MSRIVTIKGLGYVIVLSLLACDLRQRESTSSPDDPARSSKYDAQLLAVASRYRDYGRVDDMNRWVPSLCRIDPGRGRISETSRRTPHGGKLFYIYAKLRDSYVNRDGDSPVGQVIVKEAWTPEEVSESNDGVVPPGDTAPPFTRFAVGRDGKNYRPGERSGLFVMMKLDPRTHSDTDDGWIYATLDSSGERVLRSGKLTDCMRCHQEGTVDRLFGIDP